jgi:hypothetical protein
MTATAAPPGRASYRQASAPGFPATDGWRRWRLPAAIIVLIIAGATVIAVLQPARITNNYLDPASTGMAGTHALADILAERGQQVIREVTPATAVQAASSGGTLVVTSPQFLSSGQLAAMSRLTGNIVLVEPDQQALSVFAPAVAITDIAIAGPTAPLCALAAARLAGTAIMGGIGMTLSQPLPGAQLCYPYDQLSSLLQFTVGRKVITVLGSGEFLTDQDLAKLGNASLALNLLSSTRRVVWLVPAQTIQSGASSQAGPRSLTSLIPLGAWLVTLQLGVALLLAALWRARRLGSIVAERLPVVVRAAETVEGHGRLYQARRARGRAALALRTALIDRLAPLAGLPRDTSADTVATALAALSGTEADRVSEVLYGPAPDTDAALVALAGELDDLERKVRAQ